MKYKGKLYQLGKRILLSCGTPIILQSMSSIEKSSSTIGMEATKHIPKDIESFRIFCLL